MHRIRYYGDYLDSKKFGWKIRLLNWLRYWLETLVQYLVMKSLMRTQSIPKVNRKEFIRQFKQDVKAEVQQWKQSQEPVTQVAPEGLDVGIPGRQTPVSLLETFSRYTAPPRSQRYIRRPVSEASDQIPPDEEDLFEPVEKSNTAPTTEQTE